jgi:serine/threonine protein kinase
MVEKIHDYKFISKLGKGTFSDIYLVKRIKDLKYFAMKIINKSSIKDKRFKKSVKNEIYILKKI